MDDPIPTSPAARSTRGKVPANDIKVIPANVKPIPIVREYGAGRASA